MCCVLCVVCCSFYLAMCYITFYFVLLVDLRLFSCCVVLCCWHKRKATPLFVIFILFVSRCDTRVAAGMCALFGVIYCPHSKQPIGDIYASDIMEREARSCTDRMSSSVCVHLRSLPLLMHATLLHPHLYLQANHFPSIALVWLRLRCYFLFLFLLLARLFS